LTHRSDRREIKKTRPCVIVSPEELNQHLTTLSVAPLTTGSHPYPFRVPCRFQQKNGDIVLDQLRTIDSERCVRRLGQVTPATVASLLERLQEMFAK
jgi:mRNA interferase MazF